MLVIGAGVGYWRISHGPLTLGFLSGPVERFVNASLDGMYLRIKDVVVERDPEDNTIHLRIRRAQLEDSDGQLIARAPKAGIGLNARALLSGEIRPKQLEFIGPRILVKRTIDGEFQLGFGETVTQPDKANAETTADVTEGPDNPEPLDDVGEGPAGFLSYLMKALAERSGEGAENSDLTTISISDAAVSIYDEANESFWYAPKTSVVFQRVPYGISVLAHGNVSAGKNPWKMQVVADYLADTRRFKINAKVFDMVPSEMSDLVFALSNLAKVQIPLDGEVNLEFDDKGSLLQANASFAASAGLVGFPGFITESVLVDEGTLQLELEPETGDIVLHDSSIYVGGSRATLLGRFSPVANESGELVSWRYDMSARNVSLDTEGTLRDPLAIDTFSIKGLAAIEEGRLDIEDLRLNAGQSRIEVRGTFIEGPEVPAVYLRGTMRNASLPIIKKLWPPAAAPGARNWIVDNVSDESVLDGDLSVNLSSEALAGALDDTPLPNDQISFKFKLSNVTTRYFKDLPPITNATAEGHLRGNDFELTMDKGEVDLENGEKLKISNGRFYLANLAEVGTIGDITADITGRSETVLRLIDREPLGYAKAAGIAPQDLGGDNVTRLHVRLPMLQEVTFDQVEINANSELTDMTLSSVFKGGDIQGGTMVLDVDKKGLVGKGKILLNGVKADLTWMEDFETARHGTSIEAAMALDENARKKLNIDLSSFLRGAVYVVVSARKSENGLNRAHVKADLSHAEVFFDQLMWRRAAGKGAKASFDVEFGDDGSTVISNLDLKGPDHLAMQGGLSVNGKGELIRIDMPVVNLGPGNRFSLEGSRTGDGVLAIRVNGDSFDARPLVDAMFSDDEAKPASRQATPSKQARVTLAAQIKTLFFHNNEHLTNVSATLQTEGNDVQRLRLRGQFANQKGMEVTIVPDGKGSRPIQVLSDDAGAILRAVNLYTRSYGGQFKLKAVLGPPGSGVVRNGRLGMRNFEVRNEPILSEIGGATQTADTSRTTNQKPGERTRFDVLKLKFEVDATTLKVIDEALINGPAIGSTVRGSIRRDDGRLKIAGTLTPAYALNSAISNLPIVGPVIVGGEGQGLFGVTFAVTGTLDKPRVTINPVSALAPGFLRRFMEIGGDTAIAPSDSEAQPEAARPKRRKAKQNTLK